MRQSQAEAVTILSSLLKSLDEVPPVLLLGAGASFRSGVPTAADAVKEIARTVYSVRELRGSRPPNRVKPTEWETWLRRFNWFIEGADRLAENFPTAVEKLLTPAEFRRTVLTQLMQPRNGVSEGYKQLASLIMRGIFRTVLTTNFDLCVLDSLKEKQPHIKTISEVNRTSGDYEQFNVFSKCQIVWLHGRAENYSDKNTTGEVAKLDSGLINRVRPLLEDSPVVVIGYRGAEPSVMDGIFGPSQDGRRDFAHGIYWCRRPQDTLHPNVEALARRIGSNFTVLEIEGFDELLSDLSAELRGLDRFQSANTPTIASGAFDEAAVADATLEDLDLDLALSTLRGYCEKLGRSPLTRESLLSLLREQDLIRFGGGKNEITAGAILLFGNHPQRFYPHAVVSLTERGRKREIFDGNLITQYRRLIERVEAADVNPILKVKKRRSHNEETAYPPRVLTELLVNMLVHRDYGIQRPSTIEVNPSENVTFENPGSLTPKVANRLTIQTDGEITTLDRITDQRNPALCDIFFGISAMEREGTGLIDVQQLMLGAGGASTFYASSLAKTFKAVVNQPHASAGSRSVARSDVPTGLYMLNVLPFSVLPEHVTILAMDVPLRNRPADVSLDGCGTFVDRGTEVWSFAPVEILYDKLKTIVDRKRSRTVSRKSLESDPESHRVVSWLLRKHLEFYFDEFFDDGLVLEVGRKHRAYFVGKDRGERTIIWNSALRRGNRREVVKKRAEGQKAWFENEGFGYDVVCWSGQWGIRLKPFYMFTGADASTPLPSFSRAAKSTRRIKFDRNRSVELDLSFWASFLGRDSQTMNLGDDLVDNLLVDLAYITVEIPESEFGSDGTEHTNRVSAGA